MKIKCIVCQKKAEYIQNGSSYCENCRPVILMEVSEEELRTTLGTTYEAEK